MVCDLPAVAQCRTAHPPERAPPDLPHLLIHGLTHTCLLQCHYLNTLVAYLPAITATFYLRSVPFFLPHKRCLYSIPLPSLFTACAPWEHGCHSSPGSAFLPTPFPVVHRSVLRHIYRCVAVTHYCLLPLPRCFCFPGTRNACLPATCFWFYYSSRPPDLPGLPLFPRFLCHIRFCTSFILRFRCGSTTARRYPIPFTYLPYHCYRLVNVDYPCRAVCVSPLLTFPVSDYWFRFTGRITFPIPHTTFCAVSYSGWLPFYFCVLLPCRHHRCNNYPNICYHTTFPGQFAPHFSTTAFCHQPPLLPASLF